MCCWFGCRTEKRNVCHCDGSTRRASVLIEFVLDAGETPAHRCGVYPTTRSEPLCEAFNSIRPKGPSVWLFHPGRWPGLGKSLGRWPEEGESSCGL